VCPLCNQIIHLNKDEDVNRKVDEHISQGCPKEEISGSKVLHHCSFPKCKNTEVMPVLCPKCSQNFCVAHRHAEDHKCTALNNNSITAAAFKEARELRAQQKKQVQQRIDDLITQHKDVKPTAKKVQMIKMKTKAIGNASVPQDNRFYLEVIYPLESKSQPKLFFFSPGTTVGKVLDVAADAGGIENRNNQANAQKLCLVSLKTGQPLPTSLELKDLGEILQSGDSVLLERQETVELYNAAAE